MAWCLPEIEGGTLASPLTRARHTLFAAPFHDHDRDSETRAGAVGSRTRRGVPSVWLERGS